MENIINHSMRITPHPYYMRFVNHCKQLKYTKQTFYFAFFL